MDQDARNKAIARRAHEIWEEEGRPEGRHDEHWRQAERELASEGEEYGGDELPGAGAPDSRTGLAEAEPQAGEGLPGSGPGDDESQPIAATPGGKRVGASRGRRGGSTGP